MCLLPSGGRKRTGLCLFKLCASLSSSYICTPTQLSHTCVLYECLRTSRGSIMPRMTPMPASSSAIIASTPIRLAVQNSRLSTPCGRALSSPDASQGRGEGGLSGGARIHMPKPTEPSLSPTARPSPLRTLLLPLYLRCYVTLIVSDNLLRCSYDCVCNCVCDCGCVTCWPLDGIEGVHDALHHHLPLLHRLGHRLGLTLLLRTAC